MPNESNPISPLHFHHASLNLAEYQALYHQSITDSKQFWGKMAKEYITWSRPWDEVMTGSFQQANVAWFNNALVNASVNCLDRHLASRAEQVALLWEGDNPTEQRCFTYGELYAAVCQFANALKAGGVQKGDMVCLYLPMIPEAVIAMLACARIGAVHSVVFAGFSAEALATRMVDANCKLLITADESVRGGKATPLKAYADQALEQCPDVRQVIVVKRTGRTIPWQAGRDSWYHDVIAGLSGDCLPMPVLAQDPLFLLYTSGSTAKPKGIVHSTGGYLVYAAMTYRYVFDFQTGDIHWCTADLGWITGHTYVVYGPLLNGGTTLLFEGAPQYPDMGRYWDIIDKYKVTVFYTAPTAIRSLRKEGDHWLAKSSRESLRLLGSVGEPINPEVWEWYYNVVGKQRCPIVDTWWQTETGGILISALPGITPLKPGSAAWPFFGIVPAVVNDEGQDVPDGTLGKLVIKQPWPGLMQTVFKNPERFQKAYFNEFPGYYFAGDNARRDEQGYFWIAGRNDDVIKIAGHRLGTEEVESAIVKHLAVSEAAVVQVDDEIRGHRIYAYVTLKRGCEPSDTLKEELIQQVRTSIGLIAIVSYVQWTESLPKTRSGKILRRMLRKIANNELDDLGDTSTLAEPHLVEHLIKNRCSLG